MASEFSRRCCKAFYIALLFLQQENESMYVAFTILVLCMHSCVCEIKVVTVMMLLAFNQIMMSRYFFVRRAEMLLRSWIKGGPPFLVTHSIALTPTHTHPLHFNLDLFVYLLNPFCLYI